MPKYKVTLKAVAVGIVEAKDEVEAVGIVGSSLSMSGGDYEYVDCDVVETNEPVTLFED